MSDESRLKPHPATRPFIGLVMETLEAHMNAAARGRLALRIPAVADQFDSSKGRHFHLTPELFIQISGTSTLHFPREDILISPGTVVIVPRGMPHTETTRDQPGPFVNLVFAYSPQSLRFHRSVGTPDHFPRVQDMGSLALFPLDSHYRHLDDAIDLYHRDPAFRKSAVQGLLLAHLSCLLYNLTQAPPKAGHESFKVAQCRGLVMRHLSSPELNVRWLASLLSCSADYLSHLFHRETGVTLTRFINTQRIQQAQALLNESTLNISEISHACGYNDPGYFIRLFRSMVHMTPKRYRESLRWQAPRDAE
jgi:AraC-like DNA-binding protein